jgi:ADP-heptose:LPS heptosyltransferase
MKYNPLKKLELSGKNIIGFLFRILNGKRETRLIPFNFIKKVMVFRLDQKIGNGLLLVPLLNAIRETNPEIELHLHIHYPIAELLNSSIPGLVDKNWPYHQKKLLTNPFLFLKWIYCLRQEKYDLIISSHNPDNFSVSQAIMGRLCHPRMLMGFLYKDSSKFYDIAIVSGSKKHYIQSQLDLWRYFRKELEISWPRFTISDKERDQILDKFGIPRNSRSSLIWLGATGDKVLNPETILLIYDELKKDNTDPIVFATGPEDTGMLKNLPVWINKQTILWKESLLKTATFFSAFELIISADTGPAHLAVAMDIPTITIFISSNIEQYGYHDNRKHFSFRLENSDQTRAQLKRAIQELKKSYTKNV